MALLIKVPVKDLNPEQNVFEIVKRALRDDPKNAYTVQGIMIEKFGVGEKHLHGKFEDREQDHNALYSKVSQALKKLVQQGYAGFDKQERAFVYFWKGLT